MSGVCLAWGISKYYRLYNGWGDNGVRGAHRNTYVYV